MVLKIIYENVTVVFMMTNLASLTNASYKVIYCEYQIL